MQKPLVICGLNDNVSDISTANYPIKDAAIANKLMTKQWNLIVWIVEHKYKTHWIEIPSSLILRIVNIINIEITANIIIHKRFGQNVLIVEELILCIFKIIKFGEEILDEFPSCCILLRSPFNSSSRIQSKKSRHH